MPRPLAVIVLAAGVGSRMKSDLPKVLHRIAGVPMLGHVMAAADALRPARRIGVVSPGREDVAHAFGPWATAIQKEPLGTAHAVKAATPVLRGFAGDVLVVFGDSPLIRSETLRKALATRARAKAGLAVLAFRAEDPTPYGRLVKDANGDLEKIVEGRDASEAERRIELCNSGVMAIDAALLAKLLPRVRNDNAKGEYYLTDLVGLARRAGARCVAVEGQEEEFLGVNSRADLAAAEAAIQRRLRSRALEAGITLTAPETVFLSADTRFGRDVTVGPNVVFGPGVVVGDRVEIKGFCHFEGARIGAGAIVGPFARLRPGTVLGENVHIGNFVEVKNSTLGRGAKANHLAYLGDGDVGERVNVGAGVIFVNYDGYGKWRTRIGDDAFVGSNASLVAPVDVGHGANVAAGSTIVADVPAGALSFGRARQVDKAGAAAPMRARLKARAEAAKRAKASKK